MVDNKQIKTLQPKWLMPFLGGFALIILISAILWKNRPEPPDIYEMGAKGMGLSTEVYKNGMERMGRAEKQRQMSDSDWNALKEAFKDPKMRPICMQTLMFMDAKFKHRDEAIDMILEYTESVPAEFGLSAGVVLRRLEYPGWKDYSRKLMSCNNPDVSRVAQKQLGKYL